MPKPRMTRSDAWKKRACVIKYWRFKQDLQTKCEAAGFNISEIVIIDFKLAMPDSWSNKKKKAFNGTPHKTRPDIDNKIKAVFDSLLGEDSHIHTVIARKTWAHKGEIIFYDDLNDFIREKTITS